MIFLVVCKLDLIPRNDNTAVPMMNPSFVVAIAWKKLNRIADAMPKSKTFPSLSPSRNAMEVVRRSVTLNTTVQENRASSENS
jgi:hypothetical protein